jgi:DMSO/TMAO reductase YedYZ molybdopterin-dependent catalytic subunit
MNFSFFRESPKERMNCQKSRALMGAFSLLLALALSLSNAQGQNASPQNGALLTIGGEGIRPFQLTVADMTKLPRRTVRAKDHDGRDAIFEGVELYEVLKLAGVPLGQDLRGDKMALFLLVEAADGYKAVFALPEIDRAFTDRMILLADRRDGKPLPTQEGTLRLVVPDEKRHARWVRQVIKLSVLRAGR